MLLLLFSRRFCSKKVEKEKCPSLGASRAMFVSLSLSGWPIYLFPPTRFVHHGQAYLCMLISQLSSLVQFGGSGGHQKSRKDSASVLVVSVLPTVPVFEFKITKIQITLVDWTGLDNRTSCLLLAWFWQPSKGPTSTPTFVVSPPPPPPPGNTEDLITSGPWSFARLINLKRPVLFGCQQNSEQI